MAAADAIAGSAIGGATPFGWATLAAGALGGAINGTPAGPSSAGSGIGGVQLTSDFSGWTVATSGSRAQATAGDRGGLTGAGAMTGGGGLAGIDQNTLIVAGIVLVLVLALVRHRK